MLWVEAEKRTFPAWNIEQVEPIEKLLDLDSAYTCSLQHTLFWAWSDETNGVIRARTFASDWQIPEAEANGSGAMVLAAILGRDIKMIHGKGSVLYAKPRSSESVILGGRAVVQKRYFDETETLLS